MPLDGRQCQTSRAALLLTFVVWCTPQAQGTDVVCGYRGTRLLIARQHWWPISAVLAAKQCSSEPPADELPFGTRVSFSADSKKGHIVVQLPPEDMPDTRTQAGLALRLLRIVRPGCDVHGALPIQRRQGQTASAAEGLAAAEQQAYQQAVQEEDMHAGVVVSSLGPASSDDSGCGEAGGSAAPQPLSAHPAGPGVNSWVVPQGGPAAECVEVSSKRSQPSSRTTQQQPAVAQPADTPQGGPSGGGAAESAAAMPQKRRRSAADTAAGNAPAERRPRKRPAAAEAAAAAPATPSQHSPPVGAEAAETAAAASEQQHDRPASMAQQAEPAVGPSQPAPQQAPQPAMPPGQAPAGAGNLPRHYCMFVHSW